ncbi:MAG: SpoIIE family protein phosphatase [Acidimicrobiales bacterium]|nr:SpoIIE family protein phosphatase [Acidimicrobiaceae bacterium]MXY03292.1 SpoIIE family protein phosphatase [Acidimicrobiales bacterium]MYG88955.1 SpoIIE family protein phosphatase [Acidimicrobiales bacterium]MYI28621.1 SpoIIE family protein phosphatase [Acidimicrobiales bacterium]
MSQPWRILVVDDEPDLEPLVLQRMRRQIRSGKYQFEFAGNGLEALEKLRADDTIDLVLSDINMPQMDGLTLLSQLSSLDSDLRAVIISAYGDMGNIRTAMNRGAFDFVTKPVDFDDLQITIDRTVEHLRQWREATASRDKLVTLQNELDIATNVQQSILPTDFPMTARYEINANMVPARNVGGDFYDYVGAPDDRMFATVADVSDKGIPAALFMMSSRTALKGAAIGTGSPREALIEANRVLQADNPTLMFVTVIMAVYDPHNGGVTYSSAGHDPPVVIRADGTAERLPAMGGIALGVAPEEIFKTNLKEHTFVLEPGETLLLYTDGISEAMNVRHEEFGTARLLELFVGSPPTSADEAMTAVFNAVTEFAGEAPASDDITCLALHRNAS